MTGENCLRRSGHCELWRSCDFIGVIFSKTLCPVAHCGEVPAPEIATSPSPACIAPFSGRNSGKGSPPARKPGKTGRNPRKRPTSGPKHPLFGPEPGENAYLRPKTPPFRAGTRGKCPPPAQIPGKTGRNPAPRPLHITCVEGVNPYRCMSGRLRDTRVMCSGTYVAQNRGYTCYV